MTFHFREASLRHISDSTGEFYDIIAGNNNVFPTRQQIYDILQRQEELVDNIQHLIDIFRNKQ